MSQSRDAKRASQAKKLSVMRPRKQSAFRRGNASIIVRSEFEGQRGLYTAVIYVGSLPSGCARFVRIKSHFTAWMSLLIAPGRDAADGDGGL